ncbi:MAG: hypothetical protein P8N31_12675 [Planctomycetota bacterium]|nr:hypothetical protein [Planctomycetota bacterium]MDG2144402.1 hypothetical protein [Planctomycetota bacterium]
MKSHANVGKGRLHNLDREGTEDGEYEITIKVRGAVRVNRLLSWIVRSQAYDDVESISVAFQGDRDKVAADSSECA